MTIKQHRLPVGYTVQGVIGMAGGAAEVARRCGVPVQSVVKWRYIPSKHARTVAIAAALPIGIVRPDFVQEGHS